MHMHVYHPMELVAGLQLTQRTISPDKLKEASRDVDTFNQ
jgi:hypothetical protein